MKNTRGGAANCWSDCINVINLVSNSAGIEYKVWWESSNMNYRRLGDAGVKISEIGLGGWLTFGNAVDLDRGRAVMNRALELGINFLDTSNVYARGKCEEAWGEILRDRVRSNYVLATKVFFPMGDGPNDRGLSRKHIMEQCHASLGRLRTDYVDLYQCHRHDENTPLEETIRAMDDLVRQGKVLYWGFSEWPVEQIEKALQICGDRHYRPKSSQPQYSLIHRDIEAKIIPLCSRAGIGQVIWSPLAQGVLTGKYKPNAAPPANSRAVDKRQNQFITRLTDDRALLERVQRLVPIAAEVGCSMSQLALAWCLRQSNVSSCIIGATRPEQVEENVEASGIVLKPETIRRMEEVIA
jgi:voltage-dependent potassium channel beta subunit